MRSMLALLVCTGLITWAHTTKHKYFGLRSGHSVSLAVTPEQDNGAIAHGFHPAVFNLPLLHTRYLQGVSEMTQDSAGHLPRFSTGAAVLWQLQ